MEQNIKIVLNYDFDQEQGYTTKSIELDKCEVLMWEVPFMNKKTIVINLYEEDIKELLKGTGIEIDG